MYPCMVFTICVCFVCRKRSGFCPTSQLGTSSRSKPWLMPGWFLWSFTNWLRFVRRGGRNSSFTFSVLYIYSTDGTSFVAEQTNKWNGHRMLMWSRFSVYPDYAVVVDLSDSLALYRGTLALRRRLHGPSATSPSAGGKTRWAVPPPKKIM